MPGTDPTDRGAQENAIGEASHLDRAAIVTKTYFGGSSDDSSSDSDSGGSTGSVAGPEVDLRWADSEKDTTDLYRKPVAASVRGETPPLKEGDAVIVRWLAGDPPQPYVADAFYDGDAPESSGEYSMNLGGSRIEMLRNGDVNIDADGTLTLSDSTGSITPSSASGGGGSGGTGGGAYPTVPSGDAGGSGEGTGDPGYSYSQTVDAVADLGMDNSGGSAINSALETAANNGSKIEFPPGTYLFDPPSNGLVLDAHFAMIGTGETRDDVRFVYPAGKAGRMLNIAHGSSNVHIANLTFDQSNDPATGISIAHTSSGDLYVYNVRTVGKRPTDTQTGPPMNGGGITSFIMSTPSGATTHIENYTCLGGPTKLVSYPNNTCPIFAGNNTSGDIQLVNANIQNSGEHAAYMSRTKGTVRVVGGLFARNRNTNARISGKGSVLKDATVVLDGGRDHLIESDTGNVKSMRGLRFEAGAITGGKTGGEVSGCDFVKDMDIDADGMLIQVDGNVGSMTQRNNRFFDSSKDNNDVVEIVEIGGGPDGEVPPTPHAVTVDSCSFTGPGTGDAVAANRSPPTAIKNCCMGMGSSSGFTGRKSETGTQTSGCERPQTQQSGSSG